MQRQFSIKLNGFHILSNASHHFVLDNTNQWSWKELLNRIINRNRAEKLLRLRTEVRYPSHAFPFLCCSKEHAGKWRLLEHYVPHRTSVRIARLSGMSADVQWLDSDLHASTVAKQMIQTYGLNIQFRHGRTNPTELLPRNILEAAPRKTKGMAG